VLGHGFSLYLILSPFPGRDVITWSSGDRLLTAGPVKVYNEERLVHKHNGSQITLR
jgi:hypothetical protein